MKRNDYFNKKPEGEKSKVFHNSRSYDIIDLNNKSKSSTINEIEIRSKNLQKVNEENSNESISSNNDQNNIQETTELMNNNSNQNNDNQKTSINNNLSQYNFDEIDYNRKNSYVSYSGSIDSSRKSIQQNKDKITFHPVLIENKAVKKHSLIANKDSQGVYIPKTDKPKQTIGPLIDGMIVRQNSLGYLIRTSILNYSLNKISIYSRASLQRKKLIKSLCTNYQKNTSMS
eukprot:jgi/Orpsp1_1/1192495/evm.model.d7180000093771.1